MARPARAAFLNDLVASRLNLSSYICSSCRHAAFRRQLADFTALRHASSSNIPFTEKIRRKIWGTDNPPGLADPYGGPSFFERRWRQKQLQQKGVNESSQVVSRTPPGPSATDLETKAQKKHSQEEAVRKKGGAAEYVPAETWDGLEHVGHKGHWRDLAPEPVDEITSFLASGGRKAQTPTDLLSSIHQAMVEVLALDSLELKLDNLIAVGYVDVESQRLIQGVKIIVPPAGANAELEFPSDEVREQLLYAFAELEGLSTARELKGLRDEQESDLAEDEEVEEELIDEQAAKEAEREAQNDERRIECSADTEAKLEAEESNEHNGHSRKAAAEMESEEVDGEEDLYPEEIQEITTPLPTYERITAVCPENQDFLNYQLDLHSQFSLHLLQRITQLTGIRIPDPALGRAETLRSIYIYQLEALKPKPKKLADVLVKEADLADLPNVKIMTRRHTPVDKEKEVGRWKVIEAELKRRGLPVLGHQRA